MLWFLIAAISVVLVFYPVSPNSVLICPYETPELVCHNCTITPYIGGHDASIHASLTCGPLGFGLIVLDDYDALPFLVVGK